MSNHQHHAKCDGCGVQPIVGIRYKCANCVSYDLCEQCEAKINVTIPDQKFPKDSGDSKQGEVNEQSSSKHQSSHLFLKIVNPLPNYGHHRVLPNLYIDRRKISNEREFVSEPGPQCPLCTSKSGMGRLCSCGTCQRCRCMIPYSDMAFCGPCARELEVCYECGQPIQDGYQYLDEFTSQINHLQSRIKSFQDQNERLKVLEQKEKKNFKDDNSHFEGGTGVDIIINEIMIADLERQLKTMTASKNKVSTQTTRDILRDHDLKKEIMKL